MIALGIATQNDIVSPPYFDGDLYMWTIGASALALMIILVSIAYMFIAWQRNVQQGLLSANQAKDDFLSGMSHELRTPLNSMLGFTDVMLHEYAGPLNDQQRDHLRMILDSGDHLTELVEDLVNLTNIDAGKVELTLEPLDFGQLVKDCTASFGVAAQQKCITIDIDIMDIPELVDADDTRIRQVLTNLLSNAIKFSPENGRVGVSVRRNGPILEISVSDDGPGIATENRERIFEKFYQVDSALAGKTVGSGLGLYIARRLAELHGGRLNLAKSDSGTTFVLTLPIAGAAT